MIMSLLAFPNKWAPSDYAYDPDHWHKKHGDQKKPNKNQRFLKQRF